MNNSYNVREVENTNPVTGETRTELHFDAQLKSINENFEGETPNGKAYRIGTVATPKGPSSCRIPMKVVDNVSVGDTVTVTAVKLDTITALTVIGVAGGSTAGTDLFDTLSTGVASEAPKAKAGKSATVAEV